MFREFQYTRARIRNSSHFFRTFVDYHWRYILRWYSGQDTTTRSIEFISFHLLRNGWSSFLSRWARVQFLDDPQSCWCYRMFSVKRQWTGLVNIVSHTVEICTYVVRETFRACPNCCSMYKSICLLFKRTCSIAR